MSILLFLGFRQFDLPEFLEARREGLTVARVIQVQKNLFLLEGDSGDLSQQWWADLSGRFRRDLEHSDELPTVGDWVIATPGDTYDRLQILSLLPRTSLVGRKAIGASSDMQLMAANVDTIFIVSSANQDWNLRRLERYRLLADQAGTDSLLILSKTDLLQEGTDLQLEEAEKLFPVLKVSTVTGEGLDALRARLQPGETVMFIGSSGVGKSTLVNALFGFEKNAVQSIRDADGKGRHTTSSRQLFSLPNGSLLIDMPGIKELGLTGLEADDISNSFAEIEELASHCRYRDCSHESEPGCAVQAAIQEGALDRKRLQNFEKLLREQRSAEIRQDPRRFSEERKKWKVRTKAHRSMEKKRW